jgi:hypothetical protein
MAQQEQAQLAVNSMGLAYAKTLGASDLPPEALERLNGLETDRRAKGDEIQRDKDALAALEAKSASDLTTDPGTLNRRRDALRSEAAAALIAVSSAKKVLRDFEGIPAGGEIAIPDEQQLAQAYAADEELTQAIEQQAAKAVELQSTLGEAIEKSKESMGTLLSSVESIEAKVQEHLKGQTDDDIRRELEQVATQLAEYHAQTDHFATEWEELGPKIESWHSGADPAMLLEYQEKAETLVRDYYGNSRLSFSAAADKADQIGREGSEMTQRRIIQNSLQRLAHQSLEARNAWIVAARAVVPRYNVELKAGRDAVRDLTPRIDELKQRRKEKLIRQLAETRSERQKTKLAQLNAAVETATRHYQELSDEFLKSDAQVAEAAQKASTETLQTKNEVQEKRDRLASLLSEAKQLDDEIMRVRESGAANAPEVARYASLDSILSPAFDFQKQDQALEFGGAAAVIFIVVGLIVTSRKPKPARVSIR